MFKCVPISSCRTSLVFGYMPNYITCKAKPFIHKFTEKAGKRYNLLQTHAATPFHCYCVRALCLMNNACSVCCMSTILLTLHTVPSMKCRDAYTDVTTIIDCMCVEGRTRKKHVLCCMNDCQEVLCN